jgi:hypothetical protein
VVLSSNVFLCLQERSAKQFEHVVKMNDELKMKVNSMKSSRAEQEPEFIKVSKITWVRVRAMVFMPLSTIFQ